MASRLILGWLWMSACLLPLVHAHTVDGVSVDDIGNVTFLNGDVNPHPSWRCWYDRPLELDRLEWLQNGEVFSVETDLTRFSETLYLSIRNITFFHDGQYSCQAILTNGNVAGPAFAGFLRVLDPGVVVAPPIQYALQNMNTTLQCTTVYTNEVRWVQNSTITNAQLADEKVYTCKVGFDTLLLDYNVQLVVIVPPTIISHTDTNITIHGNIPLSLQVSFQSRTQRLTNVTWEKLNGHTFEPQTQFETVWLSTDSMEGTTRLNFSLVTRADRGLYRVSIHNSHNIIPANQRTASLTLQIPTVIVPPALPIFQETRNINSTHSRITWKLTHKTDDESASSLLLNVLGPLSMELELSPTQEEVLLETLPGTEYRLSLTAINLDGHATTPVALLTTNPSAPFISSTDAQRLNDTAVNLTVSLLYTGGGNITEFAISFQSAEISEVVRLPVVTPLPLGTSNRVWNAIVVSDLFSERTELTFSVVITNSQSITTSFMALEEIVRPGPPQTPIINLRTENSLVVHVQLSDIGTEPIHTVFLEVTDPNQLTAYWIINSTFVRRETVKFKVTNLSSATIYTIVAYSVNAGGQGPGSNVATTESLGTNLPVSLEGLIGIAVVLAVVVTVGLVLSIVCIFYCHKCYRRHSRKRYCTADYGEKPKVLERSPEHERKTNNFSSYPVRSEGTYTPGSLMGTSRASSCLPSSKNDEYTEYSYDGSDHVDGGPLHRRQIDSYVDGYVRNHFQYRHSPPPLSLPEHMFYSSLAMVSPNPDIHSPSATTLSFATDV